MASSDYADAVVQALIELSNVLSYLDFNKKTPEILANCLQQAERPIGKEATGKTGDYFRRAMRSDDKKWLAVYEAQAYIEAHRASDSTYKDAFWQYLNEFIYLSAHISILDAQHKTDVPAFSH